MLTEAMRNPPSSRGLQSGRGWTAYYKGPHGACCLMTYFIGQCLWVFRRAYVRWARQRVGGRGCDRPALTLHRGGPAVGAVAGHAVPKPCPCPIRSGGIAP